MAARPAARAGFRRASPALRSRREELGLSRRQLAVRLDNGTPDSTLSRIERGKLRASPARQEALAHALGRSIDDLFAPVEPPPLAERDAAIVDSYGKLRSVDKTAAEHHVSKKTVLRVLHGAEVATRDRSREREERLVQVAKLDAEDVLRKEMAKELRVSRTQIQADLRDLKRPKREPRRKHPKPKPRVCAHPECDGVVRPDGHRVARGWGDYCSRSCARTAPAAVARAREVATERHRRADEELARLNTADEITLRQFAELIDIGESTAHRYVAAGFVRTAGYRRVENELWRLVRRDEAERFRREDWPELRRREAENLAAFGKIPSTWSAPKRQAWGQRMGGVRGGAPTLADRDETDVRAAASIALDCYRRNADTPDAAIVALVVYRLERDALFDENGARRWARDPVRRNAEKRAIRRLEAAAKLPEYADTLLAQRFGGKGSRAPLEGFRAPKSPAKTLIS